MKHGVAEVQLPHRLGHDWSSELAPDEVGGLIHVLTSEDNGGSVEEFALLML